MAEHNEFDDALHDARDDDAGESRGKERRAQALKMKKQLLDDSSVGAFSQLGAAFFAAARARLAEPPLAEDLGDAEAVRRRHERMVRQARWRPSVSVEGAPSLEGEPGAEEPTPAPQDTFQKAAVQRLLTKRKMAEAKDDKEKEDATNNGRRVRKTALSFAGAEDDEF